MIDAVGFGKAFIVPLIHVNIMNAVTGKELKVLILLIRLRTPASAEGIHDGARLIDRLKNCSFHHVLQIIILARNVSRNDLELIQLNDSASHEVLRNSSGLARNLLEACRQRCHLLCHRRGKGSRALEPQVRRFQCRFDIDRDSKHRASSGHENLIVIVIRITKMTGHCTFENTIKYRHSSQLSMRKSCGGWIRAEGLET